MKVVFTGGPELIAESPPKTENNEDKDDYDS
jgi:hypothetical protein